MRDRAIGLWRLGREWIRHVIKDDVAGHAAELAFRFVLALFPFFVFLTAVGGFAAWLVGVGDPTDRFLDTVADFVPPEAMELIRPEIEQVVGSRSPGLLSLGAISALYFATSGMNSMIKLMNQAYGIAESRKFWRRYLLAAGLTLLAGTLIVAAFVLFVVGRYFGSEAAALLGVRAEFQALLTIARWPVIVLLLFGAITFLYWVAPNIYLAWRWAMPGALLFVPGWLLATALFTYWVQNFANYSATYGALGGMAVLMMWFYILAFILLAGAELNAVVGLAMQPREAETQRQQAEAQWARDHPAEAAERRREVEQAWRRSRGDAPA